ncbi:hypothetical protein D1BOALGB6SA_136 [Olavius sp. associated proteobacterium Delta 1]|nr:hypothetical protein D1BOALGB6SA_136 [Olavius sp. associated proteobacterium Delta 1]
MIARSALSGLTFDGRKFKPAAAQMVEDPQEKIPGAFCARDSNEDRIN